MSLFGRSTIEFFYDTTDDDVVATFKRFQLQPWTEYEITEDIVDIDPRSGSTWTSCSAFCTLPCCVQRQWANMDETPILPVFDRENPVLEALDLDETPILPVLDKENIALEVLDGFEVIEVLDRETPVLEVLDRFEVIEVLDSDTETPVLEAPDGAIRVRQGFQPVPPRLIFQPVLPLPSRG